MNLRPELRAIVQQLLSRPEPALSLDVVADAIGATLVSQEEIGAILDAVESAGRTFAPPPLGARDSLTKVLQAARELRTELSRSPTASEIAERSRLEPDSVRLALLFARILQR